MDGSCYSMALPPRAEIISVAIDPVALVVTECITVTSAMRKHARWAHSSVSAILGGATSSPRLEVPQSPVLGTENRTKSTSEGSQLSDDIGLASRWGLRGKRGQSMQDNPLLAAFAKLRSDVKRCKDIHSIDAPAILHPFLQVIRSSSTSAPITSLALIAINKFFAYNIISTKSPQLPLAMQSLSSAVTHCRFEATESATDEIVLFRILKLMEMMITGPGGDVLGDASMCEMMETGISMCCQVRLSELLRRSAEVSMVTMCQTIFTRLKQLEVTAEEPQSRKHNNSKGEVDSIRMEPTIAGNSIMSQQNGPDTPRMSQSVETDEGSNTDSVGLDSATVNGSAQDLEHSPDTEAMAEIKPYSLPSIRELFRVLVGLLDPDDRQHNDTMRVMALRIVDVALEVAGPSIASQPSLATLAKDTLCRHLFQLVRSENIAILSESLRVAGTLLSTCRRVLKLQQELFLSYLVACLHPRVEIPHEPGVDPSLYDGVPQAPRLVKQAPSQTSSGRSTPVPVKDRQKLGMEGGMRKPDAREAMVESVGGLVRIPSFMTELFVNYDCDADRADICLDMVGLLCRNAFPDAATWSTTNVPPLCLDALLGYIQSITDRLKDEPVADGYPRVEELREQRLRKKVIIQGATKFNEKPKGGLAFLASQGIIEDVENPKAVANFLKGTSRIDKRVLGDFLSKRGNEALLTEFLDTFNFSELRVDEALRQLLNAFRLPGEAPLIERIVSEFATKYFSTASSEDIATKDALYVLTYAIIMLNTDQHNPNVKSQNRMSFPDFARNLRGVNDGKDFDATYLEEIYDSIKTREIILPEEHDNKRSFDHAWKELLFKIDSTSDLRICDTNVFDCDMFEATWKPVIATLSYVFMSATDDTVFSRVVAGFDQCAQIAAQYNIHEALDHIILCLSSISSLATPTLPSTALNTEVQSNGRSLMVSETAVRFGRDFKAQLATVVLFRVVKGNEAAVREGWKHIVRIILNLFVNSMLTTPYSSISSPTELPPIPLQSPAQIIERAERAPEGGLFSAFTSYVSSFANDEPPEPSDKEIEDTMCTVDCVNACSFETLFSNIYQLPFDALQVFFQTLVAHIPEESTPRVIVVKAEMPAPTPVRPNGQKPKTIGILYDPSIVFVLELATILAARDAETISNLGEEVADALQSIVRDATHMHPLIVSRAVYYLLSFLRASHERDFIRVPVILHSISKLDQEMLKQCGLSIVKGLALCLRGAASLRNEVVNSPDFWSVLHALHTIPETAGEVFDILESVVGGSSPALTTDNYEPVISLLNDYAAAGSVGAAEEQKRDQAARRGKQVKKITPGPPVVRGLRALQVVYEMTNRVAQFIQQSQLDSYEAWTAYWSPPFRTLTTHSLNPCRQIRAQSLSSLQRVLLSSTLETDSNNNPMFPNAAFQRTTILFTDVVFPLITQLLKPEIFQTDPSGMGETRLQAAVLACKVFVRHQDTLLESTLSNSAPSPSTSRVMSPSIETPPASIARRNSRTDDNLAETGTPSQQPQQQQPPQWDGIRLWSRILQMMERLIKSAVSSSGQPDGFGIDEAVPESLKNIILVMANAGYLIPPPVANENGEGTAEETRTPLQKRLWEVTWIRMERFLPGLLEGVFPGARREITVAPVVQPQPAKEAVAQAAGEENTAQGRVSREADGERRSREVEGERAAAKKSYEGVRVSGEGMPERLKEVEGDVAVGKEAAGEVSEV